MFLFPLINIFFTNYKLKQKRNTHKIKIKIKDKLGKSRIWRKKEKNHEIIKKRRAKRTWLQILELEFELGDI